MNFGIGRASGLPPNIVEQLLDAEREPIRSEQRKLGNTQAKMDLVTDLEGRVRSIQESISSLASVRGFNDLKLDSGDTSIVTGAVDPQAAKTGSYNIEVVDLPQKAAAVTNGFPDRDRTEIGTGYIKFETKDGDKEIYISGENSTLDGVARAINNSNLGIRALVINDRDEPDAPFRLMLSGDALGEDNEVSYPTLYFLDGDQDVYFDKEIAAKNGKVKIDGIDFEVGDTTVTDLIPGVTLNLRQASPGRQVNISVSEDREVVETRVKDFVDAMNKVFSFIQEQNSLNENSDTKRTLGGDSLLRTIENRLRNLVQSTQVGIAGPIKRLGQLGIQFTRSGTLEFSQDKFNQIVASNPDAVSAFFAGDGFSTGFVPNLRRSVGTLLDGAFGPLSNRKRGLRNRIDQANRRIDNKERQLQRKEVSLKRKFANLEETMARLNNQRGQIAALGGGGGAFPGL